MISPTEPIFTIESTAPNFAREQYLYELEAIQVQH